MVTSRTPHKGRILVVEDDPAARLSLEGILEEEFTVESAASPHQARGMLASREYHVIVADYQMPGMTGLDLLHDVHARFPATIGILVTGHADYPEVQAARDNWRNFTVVFKPYDPDLLLRRVRNAVGMSLLRSATRRITK